mgnify:CR=1 FL=1
MSVCLFCNIISKQVPSHIVYENANILAFLDIHPRSPGHTVVVPKAHARTILEVEDTVGGGIWKGVKTVVAMIERALKPDGFTMGINHGSASGQAVDHLHIHVIPRWMNDGGRSIHGVVDNPPRESLGVLAEKIRASGQP